MEVITVMNEDYLYAFKGKVLKVIDGDTIDVELDFGFDVKAKRRLRLLNVDTPERGQENYKEATEFTRGSLLNREVIVQTYQSDAFGRYLANVWFYIDGSGYRLFNKALSESGLLKKSSTWNKTF